MITYRHHVVSLVAVFLALAVGIALGGGPLAEDGDPAAASRGPAAATEDPEATYADSFAAQAGPRLYDGRLEDRSVALLAAPGADEQVLDGLATEVEAAGGRVSARYDLLPALVSGGSTSLVDSLGRRLADEVDEGAVDPAAPTYVRAGQLLGQAVAAAGGEGVAPDGTTRTVREALRAGELLTSSRPEAGRAPLVLVVLGDTTADPGALASVVTGLAAVAGGTVVAGTTEDAAQDGALAALRADPVADQVATVDGVERALGRVTAVLALLEAEAGRGAAYGVGGTEGAVPLD